MFQDNPPKHQALALSFGIEKAIIHSLQTEEDITEAQLTQAVQNAFNLVYPDKLTAQHLPKLITSVLDRISSLQADKEKPNKPTRHSKSLGTRYAEWLSGLNAEQVCLYLSNYDVKQAEQLYWFTDIKAVQDAVTLKSQHDSHLALIAMEATLYGGGGKYQDDDSGEEIRQHDLDSASSMAALKQLGF
jgi:hypothetical protein